MEKNILCSLFGHHNTVIYFPKESSDVCRNITLIRNRAHVPAPVAATRRKCDRNRAHAPAQLRPQPTLSRNIMMILTRNRAHLPAPVAATRRKCPL